VKFILDLKRVRSLDSVEIAEGFAVNLNLQHIIQTRSERDLLRLLYYLTENREIQIENSYAMIEGRKVTINARKTPNVQVVADWICENGHDEYQLAIIIPTDIEVYYVIRHIHCCDEEYRDFVVEVRFVSDVQYYLAISEFKNRTIKKALSMLEKLEKKR